MLRARAMRNHQHCHQTNQHPFFTLLQYLKETHEEPILSTDAAPPPHIYALWMFLIS